ncbi:uncharacterized protein LOC122264146 [Penaeus japonicus]|uniref:uncharacterized protein LOC122264146 n=1 Tax=Penaeus japonicus TaxID=27405 RepID=UPI001C70EA53|nr:uncharacterized protein LOC122264146 [Penaeus japonicus]
MQGRPPMALAIALALCVAMQPGGAEVARDNLALPQGDTQRFVLPAPGLRHRPTGPQQATQQQFPGDAAKQLLQDYGGINVGPSGSGVVGNLLPLDPGPAMPQVLALDVACQREQMRVRVTFDSPFNGVMYSKGYYGNPQCSYVAPGSGRSEYEFVVVSGTCGTRFVENPGAPSYLENTVVIQNEPGIQEVWDTARGVRCVFEGAGGGDSTQRVSAGLSVAMLDQQVVSFAADSQASASLDIQIGRGPFAPSASGMVKIGELMTMVVAVEGPASADVLVRQCVAHDGSRQNPYQLTDENGCVLGSKKKILGSWQKSRDTGRSDIPVVTFSHFQAFKFPDKNDVYIECQVDLCSNGCPVCPEDGSAGRRRRRAVAAAPTEPPPPGTLGEAAERVEAQLFRERSAARAGGAKGGAEGGARANGLAKNATAGEPVRVARRLRVLSPEDISVGGDPFSSVTLVTKNAGAAPEDVCMSVATFVGGLVVMLAVLVLSSVVTAVLCLRVRTIPSAASTYPPDSSFHAFSTVSGKTL